MYIDVVLEEDSEIDYFAQDILVNESNYNAEGGNLYFTKSIEALVSESYPLFGAFLNQSWARDIFDGSIFYNVRIIFDRFVPDTTEETSRLALAQATSYTIMDYFNQYTYAEVSANMIAEIAYTETITFWSTLIAAPLIYFGSGLIGGVTGVATEATAMTVRKFIEQVVKAPIKEVFEEIIQDSLIETLVEWGVDLAGLPEDLGFWISSYLTSARELKGALGDLAGLNANQDTGGISPNILSQISLIQGLTSGDSEITNAIVQEFNQQQQQIQQDHDQSSFWKKLLQTNMLKGAFMTLSSAFLGSFGFIGLMGLGDMVTSSIKLAPQAYAEFKTKQHAKRKAEIDRAIGTGTEFSPQSMMHGLIKSTELENANIELNNEYDEQSGDQMPQISGAINLNPDPMNNPRRDKLTNLFNEIRLEDWISELTEDFRFESLKEEFKTVVQNSEIIEFEDKVEAVKQVIRSELESYPELLRFVDYTGEVLYDPNHIGFGFQPGPNAHKNIIDSEFRGEFSEALTTEEYAEELQKAYDVNFPLQPYLLKNGKFIMMPISSEITHSEWLSDNHHSIKTDKIVLLPLIDPKYGVIDPLIVSIIGKVQNNFDSQDRTWEYLSESERVYLLNHYDKLDNGLFDKSERDLHVPHLKFAFEEMTKLFADIGLITDSELSLVESIIFDGSEDTFSTTLDNLRINSQLETSIDRWFVRVKNEIDRKFSSDPIQKDVALYLVEDFMRSIYSLFGFTSKNPLYRECRIMYIKIGEILRLAGVTHFSDNKIGDLNTFSYAPSFNRLKHNPNALMYIRSLEKIISSLDTALDDKTDFTREAINGLMAQVETVVQTFIDKMQNIVRVNDKLESVTNGQLKMLLREIINNPVSDALRKVIDDKDLIRLLYGKSSFASLSELTRVDQRKLKFLIRIRDSVEQWTIGSFKDIHVIIEQSELIDLQTYITSIVDNWVFNNPYVEYVTPGKVFRFGWYHKSDPFLRREYEVAYQIFKAFRLHEDNPDIAPTNIKDMTGTSTVITGYLVGKPSETNIGFDTLITYLEFIENFKEDANNYEEIRVYETAADTIKNYVADRHLGLQFKNEISKSTRYNPIFHQDWYKASLVVFKLVTFGGINPISFDFTKSF